MKKKKRSRRQKFAAVLVASITLVAVLALSLEPRLYHWARNQIDPTYQIPKDYQTLTEDSPLRPRSNPNPDLTPEADGLSKAVVLVKTNRGLFKFRFYPNAAPLTVTRLVQLISEGFYDGLVFHRVEENFIVQGGDPSGTGTGGSGKRLPSEFSQQPHVEGSLGMARSADPDSADSQFYIALKDLPHLDGTQTIFGQVTEGMDIVQSLEVGDRMEQVYIE